MRREQLKAVLIAALRAGRAAAQLEAQRDSEDGGTANLDNVVLRMPASCTSAQVGAWIAEAYGKTVPRLPIRWFGRGWFVLEGSAGQGNRNARCREAFNRAAEAAVLDQGAVGLVKFHGYYQAD